MQEERFNEDEGGEEDVEEEAKEEDVEAGAVARHLPTTCSRSDVGMPQVPVGGRGIQTPRRVNPPNSNVYKIHNNWNV